MGRYFDDASSEYLAVSKKAVSGAPLSFVAWFNSVDDAVSDCLLAVTDYSDDRDFVMMYVAQATDKVYMQWTPQTNSHAAITTTTVTYGSWQHACGVAAAQDDLRVYLNGGSKGTSAGPGAVIWWANIDTTCIGARVYNGGANSVFAHGGICQVAAYNCALTDTDAALFHHRRYSPLKVRPQNLVAYWALRHGDNADWLGRYAMLPYNTPGDMAPPPIVYPERDDPVWGLVLPRYRPRRYWIVAKAPVAGNPWYAYAQQ